MLHAAERRSREALARGPRASAVAYRRRSMRCRRAIETTLKFYVEQNADVLASELWKFNHQNEGDTRTANRDQKV